MSTQRLEDAGWVPPPPTLAPQLSRKQSSRAEMAAIRQASKELDQELVKAKMELSRRQSSLMNADEQASRVSTIAPLPGESPTSSAGGSPDMVRTSTLMKKRAAQPQGAHNRRGSAGPAPVAADAAAARRASVKAAPPRPRRPSVETPGVGIDVDSTARRESLKPFVMSEEARQSLAETSSGWRDDAVASRISRARMSAATGGHRASTAVNRASTAAAEGRARFSSVNVPPSAKAIAAAADRRSEEASKPRRHTAPARPARGMMTEADGSLFNQGVGVYNAQRLAELQQQIAGRHFGGPRGSVGLQSVNPPPAAAPPPDPVRATLGGSEAASAFVRHVAQPVGPEGTPTRRTDDERRRRVARNRWPLAHMLNRYPDLRLARGGRGAAAPVDWDAAADEQSHYMAGDDDDTALARLEASAGMTPRGGPESPGAVAVAAAAEASRKSSLSMAMARTAESTRRSSVEARSVRRSSVEARTSAETRRSKEVACPLPRPRARRRSPLTRARARSLITTERSSHRAELRAARIAHPLPSLPPRTGARHPRGGRGGGAGGGAAARAVRSFHLQAGPRRGGAGAAVARGGAAGGGVVGAGGGAQPFEQQLVGGDAEQADPEDVGEGPDGSVPGPALALFQGPR